MPETSPSSSGPTPLRLENLRNLLTILKISIQRQDEKLVRAYADRLRAEGEDAQPLIAAEREKTEDPVYRQVLGELLIPTAK
ncbi:MAG: hypothetical protein HYZ53_28155 [Planctomycetes bacterium]|nr:hypothetical protein [Planctomycetota bacterium]